MGFRGGAEHHRIRATLFFCLWYSLTIHWSLEAQIAGHYSPLQWFKLWGSGCILRSFPQEILTVLVATIPFKMFKDVYFPQKKSHFYSLTLRKESMAVVPLAIDAAPCSNVALDFGWRINRYWSCHRRISANAATNERLSSHGVASSVSLKSWCSAAKFSSTFFTHSSTFNPFQSQSVLKEHWCAAFGGSSCHSKLPRHPVSWPVLLLSTGQWFS